MQNDKDPQSQENTDNTKKGETIQELAERHLHDPNHHTTDEEIKNAQVSFSNFEESDKSELLDIQEENS